MSARAGEQQGAARGPLEAGTLHYSIWGLAAVVFVLLLGEIGIAMRERWALPTGLVMLRRYGASDTTVSILLSTVPAVISLLVVPYIGLRSDRFRSRWGRRRPFLLATVPLGVLAMVGVAFAPSLAALAHSALGSLAPARATITLCFAGLFWMAFDCAAITAAALFSGLVADIIPRGFIGRFNALFRIVSLGVAITFNLAVFALTDQHLSGILLTIALAYGATIGLMCMMTKEGQYAADPARADEPCHPWSGYRLVLECCTQRPYFWAFAAFMMAAATFTPFNTFSQSYALQLGISKAELGSLSASAYTVTIATAFGIGWLSDRFGSIKVATTAISMYFLIVLAGYFLVHDAAGFRWFYLAHVMISGAYFTAAVSIPMALFPQGQFVRYNSSKDSMVGVANIVISSSMGPALDLSGHDYRLTLASGALCSLLCLLCLLRLFPEQSPAPALARP